MKKQIAAVLLILLLIPYAALAHGGRTDASGGHRDNNNVSGLGSYHYHHGYGPHLHPNGVCPYDYDDQTSHSSGSSSITTKKEPSAEDKLAALELLYNNLREYTDEIEISESNYAQQAEMWRTYFYCALGGCAILFLNCIRLSVKRKKTPPPPALPQVSIPPTENKPEPKAARPILVRVSERGKYHFPGCEYFPARGTTMTIEEAEKRGYKPCKVCRDKQGRK